MFANAFNKFKSVVNACTPAPTHARCQATANVALALGRESLTAHCLGVANNTGKPATLKDVQGWGAR